MSKQDLLLIDFGQPGPNYGDRSTLKSDIMIQAEVEGISSAEFVRRVCEAEVRKRKRRKKPRGSGR